MSWVQLLLVVAALFALVRVVMIVRKLRGAPREDWDERMIRELRASGANAFTAKVTDRRYQGTQTVYDIDLFGHRLEVLELGTAARHAVGAEAPVMLPPEIGRAHV